ncbi:hypothetical protein [Sinorhizobium meliloti]|uniref:hypothetical protein n=1 Tax=Rhizobium meliloti TaxID=382 RepID=UPI001296016F|nr:hypothetical protein [Sinorhizobium meliloti]MQW59652.1 hypothetical protein [Sinorhizobium meliloti]MQX93139.1 hypothetical protein [Sinorhizobium meliloti]
MSFVAAHYQKFFDEVVETGIVWTIRDDAGFPTSTSQANKNAMGAALSGPIEENLLAAAIAELDRRLQ